MSQHDKYVPAMGFFCLASLYDPLMRLVMREEQFKGRLIRNAHIDRFHRVLDLGCGTATLTLMIKRAHPSARVAGLDGDERVLAIARAKVLKSRVNIALTAALCFDIPYPNQAFDRVVTSLVIHHLSTEDKKRTFQDVLRVLKPGGELHVADFAAPHGQSGHLTSHLFGRVARVGDNLRGLLPAMMADAGFVSVQGHGHFRTLFGAISFFSGVKPA